MSITVYWACTEKEWMRAIEPESIYRDFTKNIKDKTTHMENCPSIRDYMKNTFSIKSLYSYNFQISDDKQRAFSNLYDQKFFDEHVIVRSTIHKLFSFSQSFCFFTEKESLNMSAGIFPYLEDNDITKKCIPIPGTFDIGRWFRATDFAFYLKNDYNNFQIKEKDIFQYIKFDTEEKIIFKQFKINEKIENYLRDTSNAKENRDIKLRLLKNYYLMMKNKKNIINEIKNNLVD